MSAGDFSPDEMANGAGHEAFPGLIPAFCESVVGAAAAAAPSHVDAVDRVNCDEALEDAASDAAATKVEFT